MKKYSCLAFAYIFLLSEAVFAQDPITIVSTLTTGFHEPRYTGISDKLVERLIDHSGLSVDRRNMSGGRSISMFMNHQVDCFAFASGLRALNTMTSGGFSADQFISSQPITDHTLRYFAAPGAAPPASEADLLGKVILIDADTIVTLGRDFSLPNDVNILETNTTTTSFRMLANGRGDYLVAYEREAIYYALNHGMEMFATDENFKISEGYTILFCWKSPATEQLIAKTNEIVIELNSLDAQLFSGANPDFD